MQSAKYNLSYVICEKCPQQYIGETERMLKDSLLEHKGYANTNNQTKATGIHYNQRGHSVSNLKITVLEKVFNSNPQFRKQRETSPPSARVAAMRLQNKTSKLP